MIFPPAMRQQMLDTLRERPDDHYVFPPEAFTRSDGRILIYTDGLAEFLHRWAYRQIVRELRPGEYLLANCMPGCQNPRHWRLSTSSKTPGPKKSRATGGLSAPQINAAKTHCPQDHEYTPDNTYTWRDSRGYLHRKCRTCTLQRTHQQHLNERTT